MSIIARQLPSFAPSTQDQRLMHPRTRRRGGVLALWRVCRRFPRLPFTLLVGVAALLFAGLDHTYSDGDGARAASVQPNAGGGG